MPATFYGSYHIQPGGRVKARLASTTEAKFFAKESEARKYFESTGSLVKGLLEFRPVENGITQVYLK